MAVNLQARAEIDKNGTALQRKRSNAPNGK